MKEIIYLDTTMLHSYLAQANDGLATNSSYESSEQVVDTSELSQGFNSRNKTEVTVKSGEIEIPFMFKTPSGDIKLVLDPGKFSTEKSIMSQTEQGKEIISKQLHDNALLNFENSLIENDLIHSSTDPNITGKYIKICSSFKIVDFKYFSKIFQGNKLHKFMFMEFEQQIKELEKSLKSEVNPQTKKEYNKQLQKTKSEFEQVKKETGVQINNTEMAIQYLSDITPTDSFLLIEDIISPLKSEFLREPGDQLAFKYGGSSASLKINLIGKVTSIIENVDTPSFSGPQALLDINKIFYSILHPMGILNKGDKIVSPIAIYFEVN
ncbi:DUF6414 family protein [Rummeliibacillus stabekisii]|uniref:DUF6414 family protein n=1 Tax=Rummeliibacillus stabekisii TaxID=241244 RepID=UPI0037209ECE